MSDAGPSKLPKRPKVFGLYINGQYIDTGRTFPIRTPVAVADFARLEMSVVKVEDRPGREGLIEAALQGAHETFEQIQRGFFPLPERLDCLERLKNKLVEQSENMAQVICREVGKPIDLARAEAARGVSTLEWTLREAPRLFAHEGLPTSSTLRVPGLEGWVVREARGPVLAISPFNFPLNLVLHKIAPAIAAGCPVVLKPSPKAMLTALTLVDFLHACELPPGMLSLVQCDNEAVAPICADTRIAHVSFTGSAAVGWKLVEGLRKTYSLELGGNAPLYIDSSADLAIAAKKAVAQAFAFAGQVCISVQNIFVHSKVETEFRRLLRTEVEKTSWGDASLEGILAGPVIDEAAAERLRGARKRVLGQGAGLVAEASLPRAISSGEEGPWVTPAIFEKVSREDAFYREELFGPYANLVTVDGFESFLNEANASSFRLQAGVFTGDLNIAFEAAKKLRYGGVTVNETPSLRFEPMPYGGRASAGEGREGPKYAMEAFTELKSVLIRPRP